MPPLLLLDQPVETMSVGIPKTDWINLQVPDIIKLREQAGMSECSWKGFWDRINLDLLNPKNKILAEGYERHGERWEDAVDRYLITQIAHQFWGEGTKENWVLGHHDDHRDRALIREFVRSALQYAVPEDKQCQTPAAQSITTLEVSTGVVPENGQWGRSGVGTQLLDFLGNIGGISTQRQVTPGTRRSQRIRLLSEAAPGCTSPDADETPIARTHPAQPPINNTYTPVRAAKNNKLMRDQKFGPGIPSQLSKTAPETELHKLQGRSTETETPPSLSDKGIPLKPHMPASETELEKIQERSTEAKILSTISDPVILLKSHIPTPEPVIRKTQEILAERKTPASSSEPLIALKLHLPAPKTVLQSPQKNSAKSKTPTTQKPSIPGTDDELGLQKDELLLRLNVSRNEYTSKGHMKQSPLLHSLSSDWIGLSPVRTMSDPPATSRQDLITRPMHGLGAPTIQVPTTVHQSISVVTKGQIHDQSRLDISLIGRSAGKMLGIQDLCQLQSTENSTQSPAANILNPSTGTKDEANEMPRIVLPFSGTGLAPIEVQGALSPLRILASSPRSMKPRLHSNFLPINISDEEGDPPSPVCLVMPSPQPKSAVREQGEGSNGPKKSPEPPSMCVPIVQVIKKNTETEEKTPPRTSWNWFGPIIIGPAGHRQHMPFCTPNSGTEDAKYAASSILSMHPVTVDTKIPNDTAGSAGTRSQTPEKIHPDSASGLESDVKNRAFCPILPSISTDIPSTLKEAGNSECVLKVLSPGLKSCNITSFYNSKTSMEANTCAYSGNLSGMLTQNSTEVPFPEHLMNCVQKMPPEGGLCTREDAVTALTDRSPNIIMPTELVRSSESAESPLLAIFGSETVDRGSVSLNERTAIVNSTRTLQIDSNPGAKAVFISSPTGILTTEIEKKRPSSDTAMPPKGGNSTKRPRLAIPITSPTASPAMEARQNRSWADAAIHSQRPNRATRPGLTLHTVISLDSYAISRFVHVPPDFTLEKFLEAVTKKHRIAKVGCPRITNMSIKMSEAIFSIHLDDPDSEWDWEAWMESHGRQGGLATAALKFA